MTHWERGSQNDTSIIKTCGIGYGTPSGLGTVLSGLAKIPVTLTPVGVAANTNAEQTFNVPGVAVGDYIAVTAPGITAGVVLTGARVSAANTVALSYYNATAGALTPPSGTYIIFVVR